MEKESEKILNLQLTIKDLDKHYWTLNDLLNETLDNLHNEREKKWKAYDFIKELNKLDFDEIMQLLKILS